MRIARRTLLGATLSAAAVSGRAAPAPPIRIGVLRFGTVSWEIDVIRHHALDTAAHIAIEPVELAAAQAAQVALQAGQVDMIVVDWLWVARQRGTGADWTLVPFSNAVGALIAPANSPVHDVPDLAGHALGIAGSPLDKSWLILRAYATQRFGIDLDAIANKSFGPPPLLAEQMKAGRLDALLTYWPFAAKAEAAGARRVLAVEDAVGALGIGAGVPYIGYTFAQHWAEQNPALIDGFVAASRQARTILATSDAEWQRVKPLTGAADDAELDGCATGTVAASRAAGANRNATPRRNCSICWQRPAARTSSGRSLPCRQEHSGRSLGKRTPSTAHQLGTANATGLGAGFPAGLADRGKPRAEPAAADRHGRAARDGAADRLRRTAVEPCDHPGPRRRRIHGLAAAWQRARDRHGALAAA
jgi:NitT/TauT family transport system substrate-binding protein